MRAVAQGLAVAADRDDFVRSGAGDSEQFERGRGELRRNCVVDFVQPEYRVIIELHGIQPLPPDRLGPRLAMGRDEMGFLAVAVDQRCIDTIHAGA